MLRFFVIGNRKDATEYWQSIDLSDGKIRGYAGNNLDAKLHPKLSEETYSTWTRWTVSVLFQGRRSSPNLRVNKTPRVILSKESEFLGLVRAGDYIYLQES